MGTEDQMQRGKMFNRGKTNGHDDQKKTTPHRLKKRREKTVPNLENQKKMWLTGTADNKQKGRMRGRMNNKDVTTRQINLQEHNTSLR